MDCSECGKPAAGKFCSNCGAPLEGTVAVVDPLRWETEYRYDVLMRVPEVRQAVEENARRAPKGMTGEQFLELASKLLPLHVPLDKLASVAQPLYASWGIGTGKVRTESIDAPIGRVMVRVLCSLARHGQSLRGVKQATDGCLYEAALPSDFRSFEGDLLVTVWRRDRETDFAAATKIKGQLFDWGKSRKCLDPHFAELR